MKLLIFTPKFGPMIDKVSLITLKLLSFIFVPQLPILWNTMKFHKVLKWIKFWLTPLFQGHYVN